VATFAAKLSTMTKQERDALFHSQILGQLDFRYHLDREQRIPSAHERTFHWIFSNQHREGHHDKRWSDFVMWLQGDDDPLYWITGKAGSGKSTLMKFVIHHSNCARHLKIWASEWPLVVARFYFWNSGGADQQSQEGLLRSILFDALAQRPSEIPEVFPKRWNRWLLFGNDSRPWTQTEIVEAFRRLVTRASDNFKLCLFIDGLDEFNGDHEELIDLFKQAIGLPNVKICVSSRPWVVFEDAFVHRPSLMLEHMTYPDILDYVSARFSENSGFITLQKREPPFASSLIENIAKKSCGVFLWVTLVVKSLLSGLSNFDRISDLQRRLDELPSDLEDFYGKILDSIDPFYTSHAGQLFKLVAAADGQLTALGLSFADDEEYASIEQVLGAEIGPLSEDELLYRSERTKRQLNSRCKGLLEIPTAEYGGGEREESGDTMGFTRQRMEAPRIVVDSTSELPDVPTGRARKVDRLLLDAKRLERGKKEDRPWPFIYSAHGPQPYGVSPSELDQDHVGPAQELQRVSLEPKGLRKRAKPDTPEYRQTHLFYPDEPALIRSPSEFDGNSAGLAQELHRLSLERHSLRIGDIGAWSGYQQTPAPLSYLEMKKIWQPEPQTQSSPPPLRKVAYLHRTVRDFIEAPQVKDRIAKMAEDFNPYPALLRSSVLMAKSWSSSGQRWSPLDDHVRQGMQYACELEEEGILQGELLDEMDRCVSEIFKRNPDSPCEHWAAACTSSKATIVPTGFLALAASHRLHSYISAKIVQGIRIFPDDARVPLLLRVISDYRTYPSLCEPGLLPASRMVPSAAVIQHLLRGGADPNFETDGQTIWGVVLHECLAASRKQEPFGYADRTGVAEMETWAAIVELFIGAGADPRMNRNSQMGSCIREAFSWLPNDRSKHLGRLLAAQQKRWSLSRIFAVPPLKRGTPDPDTTVPLRVFNRVNSAREGNLTLSELFPRTAELQSTIATQGVIGSCRGFGNVSPIQGNLPRLRTSFGSWIETILQGCFRIFPHTRSNITS